MKIIVIYESKFGSTEIYAKRISEALDCSSLKLEEASQDILEQYDIIILGSCLLGGELYGVNRYQDWIETYPKKHWILFTVGLSNPELTDFEVILKKHFDEMTYNRIKTFHLRGSVAYKHLSIMDHLADKIKQTGESIDTVVLTQEELNVLSHYGTSTIQADNQVDKLIDYVNDIKRTQV